MYLKLINSCSVSFDASSRWEAQRAIMAGVDSKKSLLTSQEFCDGCLDLIKVGILFDACSLNQLENMV
jgi:diaminopimelate decarboxylase